MHKDWFQAGPCVVYTADSVGGHLLREPLKGVA